MKVTRAQADENRNRIVEVAGRLFRERGFDGIGIADLMKRAGLTHGGFYGNFESKEDLIVQACERVFETSQQPWVKAQEQSDENTFTRFVESYVSQRHRDQPGTGCAFAALASDAARYGGAVRSTFGAGIKSYLDMLSDVAPGRSAEAKRKKALSSLSEMVGAVILARATGDAALSDEILNATVSNLSSGTRDRRRMRRPDAAKRRRKA